MEVYVRGDPRGRQYLDSMATGQFTLEPLRTTKLFAAAEEAATALVVELDRRAAELRAEAERLVAERGAAVQAAAAAEAELGGLLGRRAQVDGELGAVDRALRRAQATVNADPLTGLPRQQRRPALAIKIDNHPDARPQSGLNQADVVFEELVEGGATRFIAVYHSTDASPVGPVRSGRTSDLVILSNLNRALFGSSGGNAGVLAAMRASNLSSVIENDAGGAYYRDDSRDAPHNLYTDTAALYGANPGDAGLPPPMFGFLVPGEPVAGGTPVGGVSVRVGSDRVDWTWSGAGWQRTVNGRAESDADGVPVQPTNLIVQFTDYGTSEADCEQPRGGGRGLGRRVGADRGAPVRGHLVPSGARLGDPVPRRRRQRDPPHAGPDLDHPALARAGHRGLTAGKDGARPPHQQPAARVGPAGTRGWGHDRRLGRTGPGSVPRCVTPSWSSPSRAGSTWPVPPPERSAGWPGSSTPTSWPASTPSPTSTSPPGVRS